MMKRTTIMLPDDLLVLTILVIIFAEPIIYNDWEKRHKQMRE